MPLSYLRPGMITIKTNYEIKTMLHIVRIIKTILSYNSYTQVILWYVPSNKVSFLPETGHI